jgi:fatty acid desaturase
MPDEIKGQLIHWYRTPLDAEVMRRLHERSDFWGFLQTFAYLGILTVTSGAAIYSLYHWQWWTTVLLVFAHGTAFNFQINAVHELGHNTVFRSSWLNALFVRVFAFFGLINFEHFNTSHTRHHRYTLHPPDDLEVVLPIRIRMRQYFLRSIINIERIRHIWKELWRLARGNFHGEWEKFLFTKSNPERARAVIRWARVLILGHALLLIGSIACGFLVPNGKGFFLLPLLITCGTFYGGWLFFLCNDTQHIGLQDNVPDFRLCCRTFILNPFVRILYWHMNFHIEHHMYAAVPCYKLGKLHKLIRHDLPPCPHGIYAAWKEIAAIQKIQETNPKYQHVQPLPRRAAA